MGMGVGRRVDGWNTLTLYIAQVSKVGEGSFQVLMDGHCPPPPQPSLYP